MDDRPIVIDDIEISYIATETGEKVCDGVPVGRHSITGENIPQELRARIVEYVVSIEKARLKMFEELHAAHFLRRGIE